MHLRQWIDPQTHEPVDLPARALYEPTAVTNPFRAFRLAAVDVVSSPTWARMQEILVAARERHLVTNLVAFFCGSILRESPAATQYALLWMIRNLWSEDGDGPLACALQDSIYDDMDEHFLSVTLKMDVVADPQGFLQVEDTSVVYSCSNDVPVKEIIAEIARPAIIIWEDVTRTNS
ncbi:uncharacterized protein BP01DRAFT_353943, partial [Aspergillus saccharolyticus JOP 1030-1]